MTCLPVDDRVEMPEGAIPQVASAGHPILDGVPSDWPYLLGVNELTPDEGAELILTLSEDHDSLPLLIAGTHGAGRSLAWASDMSEHWLPKPFLACDGYDKLFANMVRWAAGSD